MGPGDTVQLITVWKARWQKAPGPIVPRQEAERDGWSTAGFSSSVQFRIPAHELVLPTFRVHLSTCLNLDCSHSPEANFT